MAEAVHPDPVHDAETEELFDVLNEDGSKSGVSKARSAVHRDGDWHRAVHVWVFCRPTGELILQRRAAHKDSWANLWDISCAGHVTAGEEALPTACRETAEEIGLELPEQAFEHMFGTVHRSVINDGAFINNEHIDVYLVTLLNRPDLQAFKLQPSEVSELRYIEIDRLLESCKQSDPGFVPMEFDTKYARLFETMKERVTQPVLVDASEVLTVSLRGKEGKHGAHILLPQLQHTP